MNSDESLRVPGAEPLDNARHEAFAAALATGKPAAEAYREAGYSPAYARNAGSRLANTPAIQARVAALRGEARAVSKMDREEAIGLLVDMIRSMPDEAAGDNPLAEKRMSKAGPYYTLPDKAKCLQILGSWLGWEKGNEAENKTADAVSLLMRDLRTRPGALKP